MAARTRTLRRRERKSCSCVVSWKTVELPVGSSSGLTPGAIEFQDYTATLVGTKIYVFGGLQNRERSNKLYCFDCKYCTIHGFYPGLKCLLVNIQLKNRHDPALDLRCRSRQKAACSDWAHHYSVPGLSGHPWRELSRGANSG